MSVVNDWIQSTQTVVEDLKKLGDAAGYKAPLPTPVQPSPYGLPQGTIMGLPASVVVMGAVALIGLLVWRKLK